MDRLTAFLLGLLLACAALAQPRIVRPTIFHATDCTAATAIQGTFCYEQDANTLWMCEPTAGDCDTAGEWLSVRLNGDIGDFTCSAAGVCTLDADVVAAAEMADADHGDVSWSGGVATVDSGAVGLTEIADDATCTGGQATRRNAGDTAFECYDAAGGIGGSTGATDNAVLRADGTGGATLQASAVQIDDSGNLTIPASAELRLPLENVATTPTLAFGDGDSGFYESADDTIRLALAGANSVTFTEGGTPGIIFNATDEPWIRASTPSATVPTIMPRRDEPSTGLGNTNNDDLILIAGGDTALTVTPTEVDLHNIVDHAEQSETCADNGNGGTAAALTITPATSYVEITNSDPQGCDITISETGAAVGRVVDLVVVSNAGGTVNFADTAGVTELAGAFNAAIDDYISLRYGTTTTWRERFRSNN